MSSGDLKKSNAFNESASLSASLDVSQPHSHISNSNLETTAAFLRPVSVASGILSNESRRTKASRN